MDHYLTRASLLIRLRDPEDSDAWDTFHRRYSNLILSFAMRRGCTRPMAFDVLQETMITLMRIMPAFTYDRSRGQFRSFLLKIVQNHLVNAFRRERRYAKADTDDGLPAERRADDAPDPAAALEADWDHEWQKSCMLEALERVRRRCTPHTFQVFRQYVLEQRPMEQICKELDTNRNTVYQHRARLIRMLKEEVAALQQEMGVAS